MTAKRLAQWTTAIGGLLIFGTVLVVFSWAIYLGSMPPVVVAYAIPPGFLMLFGGLGAWMLLDR